MSHEYLFTNVKFAVIYVETKEEKAERAGIETTQNIVWKKKCTNAPSELPYHSLSFKKMNWVQTPIHLQSLIR